MATLIWTESAVADLEEIGQFISKDNPPAAEKVGSNIIREAEKRRCLSSSRAHRSRVRQPAIPERSSLTGVLTPAL